MVIMIIDRFDFIKILIVINVNLVFMLQFLHIITGECRDYIHKELKRLSRPMYAIESTKRGECRTKRGCSTRSITSIASNDA